MLNHPGYLGLCRIVLNGKFIQLALIHWLDDSGFSYFMYIAHIEYILLTFRYISFLIVNNYLNPHVGLVQRSYLIKVVTFIMKSLESGSSWLQK
jgi:hypothetical protein